MEHISAGCDGWEGASWAPRPCLPLQVTSADTAWGPRCPHRLRPPGSGSASPGRPQAPAGQSPHLAQLLAPRGNSRRALSERALEFDFRRTVHCAGHQHGLAGTALAESSGALSAAVPGASTHQAPPLVAVLCPPTRTARGSGRAPGRAAMAVCASAGGRGLSAWSSWNDLETTVGRTLKGRTSCRKDDECTSSSAGFPGGAHQTALRAKRALPGASRAAAFLFGAIILRLSAQTLPRFFFFKSA